jgi:hypothetical protein
LGIARPPVLQHLSTAPAKPLRAMPSFGIPAAMSADRIATAMARIEAAMERIETARKADSGGESKAQAGSARVIELVNAHEKLREQVAESLRELDDVLARLED